MRLTFLTIFVLVLPLSVSANTITVPNGGDLQAAINNAQPGDTINLDPGGTYNGPYTLPLKSGSSYITIQSSRASELSGRVSPAQSTLFAKLQSSVNGEPVIKTVASTHHYKFVGIEFSTSNASVAVYDLIRFGDGKSAQTSLAQVPHDLIIDKSWIHGYPTQDVQRGVSMNCVECWVTNSYISDIHGVGFDSQAICGWNGPGPFHILNNYLEGAGENIMFGGVDSAISELTPSDIEIKANTVFKPLTWKVGDPSYAGKHWTVKNLFELKNAKRVVVDGNTFSNNWTDGQSGIAILFTVRNQECTAPWSTVQNVTFSNNTVKNAEGALNFLGKDNEAEPAYGKCSSTSGGSVRGSDALLSNNLFYNIKGPFLTLNGFYNVSLDHNTHVQAGNLMTLYGEVSTGYKYTNNLTIDHDYGIFGDGGTVGAAALSKFTPGYVMTGNVIANPYDTYPAGNSYPTSITLPVDFRSPIVGVGADVDKLLAAQSGATPIPSPTPTPTPTPVPSPTPSVPTPSPSPSPSPLTADWPWPSKYADQPAFREQVRKNGWVHCQIYNSRYWCERP